MIEAADKELNQERVQRMQNMPDSEIEEEKPVTTGKVTRRDNRRRR